MKSFISFLLTLAPMIIMYGFIITLVWLGLHYENGWVIAIGIIYMCAIKLNISTGTKEK